MKRLAKSPRVAVPITYEVLYSGAPAVPAPAKKKKRPHLEAFVPEQRHMYGEERVLLPCPNAPKKKGGQ